MKPIRIAILVCVAAAVVAFAGIGRPDFAGGASQQAAGITVTGTGSVRSTPDQADFSLGVQTNGQTAREALARNSERMSRVLAAIEAAGIAKDDVKTQEVSVSPSYEAAGKANGYTARNTVSVHIRVLSKAAAVLDGATKAGANDVYGPTFAQSDSEALQAKALRAAVGNARSKAQALADAANVRLGSVTAITEGFQGGPQPWMLARSARTAAAAVPIQPGKEDIQATVTVTFAIG